MSLENIVPPLRNLAIPIGDLVFDPTNARTHDSKNLQAIQTSLERFGQRLPIVVQKQGNIIRSGNGRVTAMRAMGWTHVAAVVVDEADADAAAFALADNRSAELADWDWKQLSETLAQLEVDLPEFDLNGLGWDDTELEALQLTDFWDNMEVTERHKQGEIESSVGRSIGFSHVQIEELTQAAELLGYGAKTEPWMIVAMCKQAAGIVSE
jgi:hypothetical protein